ncbi:MAG TPA: BPTI/Kunitz domain-containing protein [Polyangiaceae bacterium]|nr:BPTI/Kunitz domain-containing protein [Polyangiaceae bacterium]
MFARSLFAPFALITVALVSGAACGGSTTQDHPGSSGSPASGGNSASGGAAVSGGRTSSGGRAETGGQGSGGSGGAISKVCDLPQAAGNCDAYFPKYWYNKNTGQCESFIYGGCGGNENRFDTLEACRSACGVAKPSIDFCNSELDCTLISAGCCSACEPIVASDLISINVEHLGDRKCDVACGACPPLADGQRATQQYFKPGCEAHKCTVVDIRETDVVSCQTDGDCILRLGSNCCEACGGEPIAVNRDANLTAFFCPGGPTPCPACVPKIPAGYGSACIDNRCSVTVPVCTSAHPCP